MGLAVGFERVTAEARRWVAELRYAAALRVLPMPVARFQWRARRVALRTGDRFSLDSVTRPGKLAALLELARDRRRVVELGTATAWTSLSLALADRRRQVITYDPFEHPERDRYLGLVDRGTLGRVTFVARSGEAGPAGSRPVDLLYIDSSHDREQTIREMTAWRPVLRPGAVVVFDDYEHPDFPGVKQAIEALGLRGQRRESLFVHRVD